jgi:hypothetical protein
VTEFNFANLKAADVTGRTADFEIGALPGEVVLIVKPATQCNPAFFQASFASVGKLRRVLAKKVSVADLDAARDVDRDLFAKHVVVGWRGVSDATGAVVPFSTPACAAFLKQLPPALFDDLRVFCRENGNFLPDLPTGDEVAQLGESSPTG